MNYRVNCDIQISVEERSDRFAARTNVSGMTIYGATESEATEKVHEAIKVLFSSIVETDGKDALASYLDNHEVGYEILPLESDIPVIISDGWTSLIV